MQEKSFTSVKITWFDRHTVIQALRQAVKKLAASHPEIKAVFLFGSLIRGDAVPGSDADLLIILNDSDLPFIDRIPHYIPSGCKIDVDVFPYTEKEIQKMMDEGNYFIKRALKEGIELFKR